MRLEFYSQILKKLCSVEVTPVRGLAEAYRDKNGREFRLLPSGRVLNGYFGIEIGVRACLRG
jgi:hypothetical protein